jgi:hypothetical protein
VPRRLAHEAKAGEVTRLALGSLILLGAGGVIAGEVEVTEGCTRSGHYLLELLLLLLVPEVVLLALTLGRVVECVRNHVRLLDNLPNDATLAQKIVASSVFSVTEILAIEGHKFNNTFLHVAFGSQSLLKPTSDQIGSDTN